MNTPSFKLTTALLLALATLLPGCAAVAVVDTAASLAVGTVGLVGKVVGATVDAVLPGAK